MRPTPKRILFWVCIGVVGLTALLVISFIVWRVRLAHDVNAKLQALRAAGLPTSGAELNNYYPAVPDNENAGLVMTQAFTLMRTFPDGRSNEVARFKLPSRGRPLTTGQKQLLAEYVELNAAPLAKAREAFALTNSRYPIDFSWGVATPLPHLARLKELSRTAEFQMLLALDVSHTSDAAASITDILRMARTLEGEPALISQLVHMSMIRIATDALERGLTIDSFSEAELAVLARDFADGERTNLVAHALIGERALALPYFRMSWAEIKRISQNDEDVSQIPAGPTLPGPQPALVRVTGFFDRDMRFFLGVMETNIAIASLPTPRSLAAGDVVEKASEVGSQHYYILSSLLLPALSRAVVREAEALAHVHAAKTALAIERFRFANGSVPGNLNELTPQFLTAVPMDPFDGAPLRYHRLVKGYVIYSVGSDGPDDGGREKPANWKSTDKSSYDITFTVER